MARHTGDNPVFDRGNLVFWKRTTEERHAWRALSAQSADKLAAMCISGHQDGAAFTPGKKGVIVVQTKALGGTGDLGVTHDASLFEYGVHILPIRGRSLLSVGRERDNESCDHEG